MENSPRSPYEHSRILSDDPFATTSCSFTLQDLVSSSTSPCGAEFEEEYESTYFSLINLDRGIALSSSSFAANSTTGFDDHYSSDPTDCFGAMSVVDYSGSSLLRQEGIFFEPGFRREEEQMEEYACDPMPSLLFGQTFRTSCGLALIVPRMNEILKERKISYEFSAADCTWDCMYLSGSAHCKFAIRVYRYPSSSAYYGERAIELQLYGGEQSFFTDQYRTIKGEFMDSEEETALPASPLLRPFSSMAPKQPIVNQTGSKTDSFSLGVSLLRVAGSQSTGGVLASEHAKDFAADLLVNGSESAATEGAQMACNLYANLPRDALPSAVDLKCVKALVGRVVVDSKTGSDYACQHCTIALSEVSTNAHFASAMLSSVPCEQARALLEALKMAASDVGSYDTFDMRKQSAIILFNLQQHGSMDCAGSSIDEIVGEKEMAAWRESKFCSEVRGEIGLG